MEYVELVVCVGEYGDVVSIWFGCSLFLGCGEVYDEMVLDVDFVWLCIDVCSWGCFMCNFVV